MAHGKYQIRGYYQYFKQKLFNQTGVGFTEREWCYPPNITFDACSVTGKTRIKVQYFQLKVTCYLLRVLCAVVVFWCRRVTF